MPLSNRHLPKIARVGRPIQRGLVRTLPADPTPYRPPAFVADLSRPTDAPPRHRAASGAYAAAVAGVSQQAPKKYSEYR